MSAVITAIGTALPERRVTHDEALRLARAMNGANGVDAARLERIHMRTGVRSRHVVISDEAPTPSRDDPASSDDGSLMLDTAAERGPTTGERMIVYEREALRLAVQAAERALRGAGREAASVTHLITASCTGFAAPGVDAGLLQRLCLRDDTERTNVGFMGCHGAINALRVARCIANAEPGARVLVVCVELCSIHMAHIPDAQRVVANALFADGAGAVVVEGRRGDVAEPNGWSIDAGVSRLVPGTAHAMSWRIGDHGFEMTLSPDVPRLIHSALPGVVGEWLGRHGLRVEDVDAWAVHPGGPRVLDAAARSLGLAPDSLAESHAVLAELGNMSSPTVLFVLDRIARQPGVETCVMLAFGPGLTIEGQLLRRAPSPR
ncbi:MAG: type III polyketide synthase [Phycisphaerales bacterium]|nr:MAG: type III polyketide synthase [Phycisphaerales bacterium]